MSCLGNLEGKDHVLLNFKFTKFSVVWNTYYGIAHFKLHIASLYTCDLLFHSIHPKLQ